MNEPEEPKPYAWLHGRPVTREELGRYIYSHSAMSEFAATYLAPIRRAIRPRSPMVRIEILREENGMLFFAVREPRLFGQSRQPLLDACRKLKSMGVATAEECGLFRNGSADWDIRCTVGVGAGLTVSDPAKGGAPKFVPFREYPG